MLVVSFILVATKVSIPLPDSVKEQNLFDRIRRMDFFGSVTLVGTVGSLLLGFSLKTTEDLSWSNPLIYGLFISSAVFGVLFVFVELRWAPYPVMPLHLITQRTPLAVSLTNFFGSVVAFSMASHLSCVGFMRTITNCLYSSIIFRWYVTCTKLTSQS